ncbi:hypothetical protein ANN_15111 [Periplaneta americana]|uniref:Uncharacterized protein n=1 Tax=Periplaneta americana TaxID=6978 RepID=A0ABQ8SY61_PERAM|nr:hypothetical protein ANN_15111 [Periplaneta americana]
MKVLVTSLSCSGVNKALKSATRSAVKNLKIRIYKTVTLPVVLYGCETWTLTLREEHRFRVFENKVLRKIFGAKKDKVTGEWRKLHNTELHALYVSPDIIRNIKSRRLRWAGHVARMGASRTAYRVLVGRPEGKRPLGRPRRRWEDNIKMDLREVGYDDRDWINLANGGLIFDAYLASEQDEDDNESEMSPRSSAESYPAFALNGWGKTPEKKSQPGTWFRERHCDDTPFAGQRQIQMERSLTPVSERVGVGGIRKQEKCTAIIASHNVLINCHAEYWRIGAVKKNEHGSRS